MAVSRNPAPSGERFKLAVLGACVLSSGDHQVTLEDWPRKAGSLLRLLAVVDGHRVARDEAIELLWPEVAPEAGVSNLKSVVFRLRRALDGRGIPAPIVLERGWVLLNPACSFDIDVDRFRELAGRDAQDIALLEEAAQLYRGDPLPEDRYEDWASPVREHLQTLWRDVCLRLIRLCSGTDDWERAAYWAERLLQADPLDEEGVRALIRVLARAGRRAEALRRYQQLEAQLREEMNVQPDAETVAVVEELASQLARAVAAPQTSDPAAPASRDGPPPMGSFLGALPEELLVGREEEVERLVFAADIVEGGAGRLFLLAGEPGVGKTRLAQEVFSLLHDRTFRVVIGRCRQSSQQVFLAPFREALRPLYASEKADFRSWPVVQWPALEMLVADRSRSPAGGRPDLEEQLRLFLALTDLITAEAAKAPIALLLDDLQWADAASIDLLQHLAHSTRGHRVLLFGTYRDGEVDPYHPLGRAVRELDREGLVERLPVRRLTEEGTAALVAAAVGDDGELGEFAEFVHRRTRGNPLYIHKLLHALGGHYRLVRQIGVGGMGKVFEAVHTDTGERVAAKIMFSRTETDPAALRRFEQEGAVLARLQHPNIVQVRGTFLEEHAACIVMELLDGRSLGQILRAEGDAPLPLPRVKRLMEQVASALSHAHEHGVIHRDVKPENLMVVGDDQVKVADFGIARLLRSDDPANSTVTSTRMTLGTPLYMSPEQIRAQRVDPRSDIYSLGGVMYHLVTGSPPFGGEGSTSLVAGHLQEAPRRPSELRPGLPPDWDALILTALSKDPDDRFPSARAMQQAIAGLSTEPVQPTRSRSRGEAATTVSILPGPLARRAPWLTGTVGRSGAAVLALSLAVALVLHLVLTSAHSAPSLATVLGASWPGPVPASFERPAGVALDQAGNVYVSDSGNNRIEKFSPGGRPLGTMGGSGSKALMFRSPQGIAADTQGHLYVVDAGNNRVQEISADGRSVTRWGSLGLQYGQFFTPHDVAIGSQGAVYVTDWAANGRVQVFSSGGTSLEQPPISSGNPVGIAISPRSKMVVADSGCSCITSFPLHGARVDAAAEVQSPVSFQAPAGVAVDAGGNLYVTDSLANQVVKLSPDATQVLARWGAAGRGPGQFRSPNGIAVDGHGYFYVADSGNRRVQKLAPNGQPVAVWVSTGPLTPPPQKAAIRVGHMFNEPDAVAVAPDGTVYVNNNNIVGGMYVLKLSALGHPLARWPLFGPDGAAVDKRGDVYITDPANHVVRKLSPAGKLLATIDTGDFTQPHDVVVDAQGNIYVADIGGNRVEKLSPAGRRLARWGGYGSMPGKFSAPHGIALDAAGNIYVSEVGNNRIQKLSPAGRSLDVWGSAGGGPGQFNQPWGVAVDARGSIYVADAGNSRIQKLSPSGKPLGQWDSFGSGQFNAPCNVGVDRAGNVLVDDCGNNEVEKLSPSGGVLAVWK